MLKLKKFIPKKIRTRFANRPVLQKITKNIGWLSFSRLLELIVAFTVGVWVARYLGPEYYGLLNFAIAFVTIFGPLTNLGLDTLLNRELVNNPKKSDLLLGTVFRLKIVSSTFFGILMILIIFLIKPDDFVLLSMVFVFALGNIISSFTCVGIYFDSKIESHKVVKSSAIALLISNLLKIFFILFNFSVFWFAICSLINTILLALTQLYYYSYHKNVFNWRFNFKLAKGLVYQSWPLLFSGIFAIIYLNIDQLMIGLLLNNYELGIYVVAVKISLIFNFLPSAIALSIFPAIMNSRKLSRSIYFNRLQKMFDYFTWFSILLILPVFLMSNILISFLYGGEYIYSGYILAILIWIVLAIFIKSGVDIYVNSEKLYKLSFYSTFLGAVCNILINLILIPIYGIAGAAFATIFSYFFVAYLSNLLFKETRKLFFMQIKSFNIFRILKEMKL